MVYCARLRGKGAVAPRGAIAVCTHLRVCPDLTHPVAGTPTWGMRVGYRTRSREFDLRIPETALQSHGSESGKPLSRPSFLENSGEHKEADYRER